MATNSIVVVDSVPPDVAQVPLPLVGPSDAAGTSRLALADAAGGRAPVLLVAEVGCRPGDVARALHEAASPGRPYVAIYCSSAVAADTERRLCGSAPRRVPQDFESVGPDAVLVAVASGTLYLEHVDELPASAE